MSPTLIESQHDLKEKSVRREVSRIDRFSRKAMRRIMFKSPMCITPLPPLQIALGEESHGSILSGNYLLIQLTSAWRSTSRAAILRFIDQAGFRTVAATMKRKRKFLGAELQCHQRLAHQALCSETKTSTHRQC
jgi:hypothetical protein